jgi:ERCC4-type nuclease
MADKMAREFTKGTAAVTNASITAAVSADYCNVVKVSKKANITKENIGQMILMQIPGISSTIANEIMQPFKSFIEFLDHIRANTDYLEKLTITDKKRKLGSNVVKGIQEFILNKGNVVPF